MRLAFSTFIPRRFPAPGLQGRSIMLCVLLMAGGVLAVAAAIVKHAFHDQVAAMREDALVDAVALSYNAEPYLLSNDREGLQRTVNVVNAETAIVHAVVLDREHRTVAEFRRRADFRREAHLDPTAPVPGPVSRGSHRLQVTENQLLVVTPIWPDWDDMALDVLAAPDPAVPVERAMLDVPLGFLAMTFSLEGLRRERVERLAASAVTAGTVIVFGVGLTVICVRRLLNPIHALATAAERIAAGDFSHRAPQTGLAEIGQLARAFNKMADTLAQHAGALESQVLARTAELQRRTLALEAEVAERRRIEAELRAATGRAEEASRAKSEFLANMSHEIRTPMTAILGFAETLEEPDVDGKQHALAAECIGRNGRHLLEIINDMLDISKIEARRLEIRLASCSPQRILAEVAASMQDRARQKGLSFDIEYRDAIPERIVSDETRLRQILCNLVGNAIKFTDHGGVRIRVGLVPEADEPLLQFEVIDTGIGIAPAQIARLFQPFSQVDASLTRRFGGTGLGLMISKRLAAMLGGDITVRSELGAGSTFTATVAAGPLDGVKRLRPVAAARPAGFTAGGVLPTFQAPLDLRVLLAEDGPDNQRLIALLLRKAGMSVEIAGHGQEAIDMIAASPGRYDVVLMDVQMPVLDGYEATRRLRRSGYEGAIIALTAHTMSGDREKCLAAGCDDYANKPIDRNQLLDLIRRHACRVAASS